MKNNRWTKEETEALLDYAEASDHQSMPETYEYIHHMMYNEGNYPDFPVRTLRAVTDKVRKEFRSRREEGAAYIDFEFILQDEDQW